MSEGKNIAVDSVAISKDLKADNSRPGTFPTSGSDSYPLSPRERARVRAIASSRPPIFTDELSIGVSPQSLPLPANGSNYVTVAACRCK